MLALLLLALVCHASALSCPTWLAPVCESSCVALHCVAPLEKCIADGTCRARLEAVGGCMKTGNVSTDPLFPNDCLAPDNALMDDFFYCAMEEHRCLNASTTAPPTYPACRDATVAADPSFALSHLAGGGDWYKVHSWRLGEPVECMACQTARFTAADAGLTFASNWTMPDPAGRLWPMAATASLGPRGNDGSSSSSSSSSSSAGKLFNWGRMFGLTFWEPYTVVVDGTAEAEPFVFFYVCGGTLQGNYTTAFALARTPTASPALRVKIRGAAEKAGLSWSDFCTVDNSCFKQ